MSDTLSTLFQTQWDSDVFVAYQRDGSLLRGFTREKWLQPGDTAKFQKYGVGSIGTKGLHGDVPTMNATHSIVTVQVQDYYGGEYINDIDQLKTNVDERQLAAMALAKAAGRKVDDLITTAALASLPGGQQIAASASGFTKTKVLKLMELFNLGNIPDDGNRICLVGAQQWTDLLQITEFANSQYIGGNLPWTQGAMVREWLGIKWMFYNGLTKASTTRKCIAWHRPAMGVAMLSDLKTNFDWVPTKGEWFTQIRVSCNAVRIEDNGVFEIDCTET